MLFTYGLFADGLNNSIFQRVGHRQELLPFGIGSIESTGAAQRVSPDNRHLFKHDDAVLSCPSGRHGGRQTRAARTHNHKVITFGTGSFELLDLLRHRFLQSRQIHAALCESRAYCLLKGYACDGCSGDGINIQCLIPDDIV